MKKQEQISIYENQTLAYVVGPPGHISMMIMSEICLSVIQNAQHYSSKCDCEFILSHF